MEQLSMFDILYDEFKIKNKIRLIELFAGVGSQAMALRELGADFEHYRVGQMIPGKEDVYRTRCS